jgi:hypothetical protein
MVNPDDVGDASRVKVRGPALNEGKTHKVSRSPLMELVWACGNLELFAPSLKIVAYDYRK